MKAYLLPFLCILFLGTAFANAQEAAPSNSESPIEITAQKAMEWQRAKKQYIARENVVVKQGGTTITADLLTADYREGAQTSMEIWQLTAEGNVTISDGKNTAYGDLGVYDVTAGVATLTGQDLRLVSPDQTVTAKDKMEYFNNERKARAVGNAKVVRTNDTLTANTITAFFKDGSAQPQQNGTAAKGTGALGAGGGNLDRLEADGNVVIKTPDETLSGNKAIYRADTNTAELIGNVKVLREKNVLEGTRAEVNLTTNVSKMFGSKSENGRVRGVFYPGSSKPGAKPQSPAPTAAPVAPAPAATKPQQAPVAPQAAQTPVQTTPAVPAPAPAPKAATPENAPFAPTPAPARVSPRIEY